MGVVLEMKDDLPRLKGQDLELHPRAAGLAIPRGNGKVCQTFNRAIEAN
jgi:hypothetical protein